MQQCRMENRTRSSSFGEVSTSSMAQPTTMVAFGIDSSKRWQQLLLVGAHDEPSCWSTMSKKCSLQPTLMMNADLSRGRLIPMSTHPKLANKPTKRLALQHELLAFSSFPELRLFAAFVKLDQGFRMKLSPALKTHSILQTIGWSEVSNVKVTIPCSDHQRLRSRTRRSGWRPFTMWTSCSRVYF